MVINTEAILLDQFVPLGENDVISFVREPGVQYKFVRNKIPRFRSSEVGMASAMSELPMHLNQTGSIQFENQVLQEKVLEQLENEFSCCICNEVFINVSTSNLTSVDE